MTRGDVVRDFLCVMPSGALRGLLDWHDSSESESAVASGRSLCKGQRAAMNLRTDAGRGKQVQLRCLENEKRKQLSWADSLLCVAVINYRCGIVVSTHGSSKKVSPVPCWRSGSASSCSKFYFPLVCFREASIKVLRCRNGLCWLENQTRKPQSKTPPASLRGFLGGKLIHLVPSRRQLYTVQEKPSLLSGSAALHILAGCRQCRY